MPRLVLVDTADELPGLLPLHAWSALMSSDLVLVGAADHAFLPHLEMAELRHEVVEAPESGKGVGRADLLSGVGPQERAKADAVVDRARNEGEVVYLFGPTDDEGFTRTMGMEAARSGVEVEVVYFGVKPKGTRLLELVRVMDRLRDPGGCPWDAKQDHRSLARYAVEEVYELLEAIEADDPAAIKEELGDVLLQVVFHARVAQDEGTDEVPGFTIDDVADAIASKLISRHPHVFADVTVADADEVVANWDALKAAEKPERTGPFDGVPTAQPALGYAEALQRRAAKAGFEWSSDDEAAGRLRDELEEFLAAGDAAEREREAGDLLLAAVCLARRHGIDAEMALRGAAARFRSRFEAVAARAGGRLSELTREEWLALWAHAKRSEATAAD